MTPELIARYQPGGDIYATLQTQYGPTAAASIAAAAQTGDETQINAAISQAKFGSPLDTSTASIFANQIITDPFAAPAASFNDQIKKLFANLFGNPFLLIAVVAVVFFAFGGANRLRKKIGGGQ